MAPSSRARAALRANLALVFLAACSGNEALAPRPAPVEVVIAPPPPPIAATVEPAPSAIPSAAVVAPSPTPEVAPPETEVVITPGPAGSFGGASGNVPGGINSIWGVGDLVFAVSSGVILRSEDRGLHFKVSSGPRRAASVWGSSADDVYVAGDTMVRSTDRGLTWTPVTALPRPAYLLWGSGPSDVYAAGGLGQPFLLRSTDHGATWTELAIPVPSGWIKGITGTGPREVLVFGTEPSGAPALPSGLVPTSALLLRSTDSGRRWARLPTFKATTTEFEESNGACFTSKGLFAASSYGLYFTPNLGRTWKLQTNGRAEVLALACRGKDVLVGARNRQLAVSRDAGATWVNDPIGALWTAPSFSSVQAAFVSEGGEAFVGFEGLYTGPRRGSLFRRSP